MNLSLGSSPAAPDVEAWGLSDEGLTSLLELGFLEELLLCGHRRLEARRLQWPETVNVLPLLRRLDLSGCASLSADGLLSLASRCGRLRELRLQGCELGEKARQRVWDGLKGRLKYCRRDDAGWGVLPVPDADDLEFRDRYFERKALEKVMLRRIFRRYRLYRWGGAWVGQGVRRQAR
jgi:hypothetical protein